MNACSNDITEYNLDGEADGNARLVQAVKSDNPDLIVAIGVLAAQFARQELSEFAVLYVMVPKLQTRALTGDNIGGISLDIPIKQQLNVYRSMVKDLNAIGVIFDPQRSGHFIEEARKAAELEGLVLLTREVTSRKQVPAALRDLLREEQIDALWMIPDETVVTPESFKFLLITSIENDLPFLAASDIFVKVGALASVTPDYMDLGRQSCELANALTAGEMTLAGMDTVAPAKVNLAINLKTAQQIGLSIPEEVIESADVVYHEGKHFYERGVDQFEQLYKEGEKRAKIMAIPIHAYISGQPHRFVHLERLYRYLKRPGVTFMSGQDIYEWYRDAAKTAAVR